ncbi:hypothetical protein [Streptomyces sp. NBC_00310]|uniref:hypothetical protein n=1 Tax=unclassified Streptomyces TaxID=2593676 RepID=UPI003FA75DF5
MTTTITAVAATALVLFLMIPLSGKPLTATVLVFLMGLTGHARPGCGIDALDEESSSPPQVRPAAKASSPE